MEVFPWCVAYCTGSPRVIPGISTYPSCSELRLTRVEIGAEGFGTDVGDRVAAGTETGGLATGLGNGSATGVDFGMGTYTPLGGSGGAARIGVIHGASG